MALSPPVEAKYRGVMQSLRSIVATEGVARLWRGIPVVLVGAGPAHGMYFMAYEWAKVGTGKRLGRNNPFGHSKCCLFYFEISVMCLFMNI